MTLIRRLVLPTSGERAELVARGWSEIRAGYYAHADFGRVWWMVALYGTAL